MEAFEVNERITRTKEDAMGRWYKSHTASVMIEVENVTEGKEEAPLWEVETHYYCDGQHSYTLYRCPVCHARYMSPTDYCPHCGKPLNRTEG